MSTVVITPPDPIVTLDEAKLQLRIELDDASEDVVIEGLIAAATGTIDGPNGWLGRSLGQQTLELRGSCFLPRFELLYGPVTSLTSVTYLDASGQEQTAPADGYFFEAGGFVRPILGWPGSLAIRSDSVRIRYVAGWPAGDGGAWTGPTPIKHAIMMMVTRLYHHRGEDIASSLVEDRAIAALLGPWRAWYI